MPSPSPNLLVARSRDIVASNVFRQFITFAILVAGALVGIETDNTLSPGALEALHVADAIVLAIFAFEVVVKMIALSPASWRYFRDPWNVFDFVIVAGALLPFISSYALLLRLFRLLRVLKLVRALPRLQRLVGALLHSLPSMAYVLVLLLILFYVYGCAGVFFFAEHDPDRFGTLPRALLALFQVVTLEDWPDLMSPQMGHAPAIAIGYFVSFILIGTMVMLNLVIGVVLEGMKSAELEQVAEARRLLTRRDASPSVREELAQLDLELVRLRELTARITARLDAPSQDSQGG